MFEVHASEDILGKDGTLWYQANDLVDTITTTGEGKDASKVLPLGKYYLIEVSAPDGYIFTDERYEANLEYADDHTALVDITVEAHNDYLPVAVSLEKEMEIMEIVHGEDNIVRQTVSSAPGKGFVFGLYNDRDIHYDGGTLLADTLVATGVTDADGKLTFSGVYPHGQYYIRELSTLDGWKLNPNTYPVDLTVSNRGSDNVISVTLPEPVKNDLIYTHVTLTKMDITGQETIPGALIEVTDSEGNVIYRAYTDEHGEIPDKLANIRAIQRDHEMLKDKFWDRFNQKDPSLHGWYYRSVGDALSGSDSLRETSAFREYVERVEAVFGVCKGMS